MTSATTYSKAGIDALFAPIGTLPPTAKMPARRAVTTHVDLGIAGSGVVATSNAASSNLNDTTNYARGSQSAAIVTRGDGTVAGIRKTGLTALNLTGRRIEFSVQVSDWTKLSNLYLYLGDGFPTNYWQINLWDKNNTIALPTGRVGLGGNGEWITLTADLSSIQSTTGTPNIAAITFMQVSAQDDNTGTPVTLRVNHIGSYPASSAWTNGVISLSFDDGFASQYTAAKPVMNQYDYQGTFYVIADRINNFGSMTEAQLHIMQDVDGHEIGAHAYYGTHHDQAGGLSALSLTALDTEFRLLKRYLVSHGFFGADHFAYPQGIFTPAMEQVLRGYFGSARLTQAARFETPNPANRSRLCAVGHAVGNITLAQAKANVDKVLANNSWGHFYFHDIVTTPVTGTQWATSDFQALMTYIAGKGIPVRTVGDVLATS